MRIYEQRDRERERVIKIFFFRNKDRKKLKICEKPPKKGEKKFIKVFLFTFYENLLMRVYPMCITD